MNLRRRVVTAIGIVGVSIMMLSACAVGPVGTVPESSAPAPVGSEPVVSEPAASPDPQESPNTSAVDAFLAWVDDSRVPNVDAACARLTPELSARMIAELNASGQVKVDSCEEMIAATAELYRALGQSAEVDIAVQEETETGATLFVTYLDSGDCGTVVMARAATDWVITEMSEECAAG